jgi:hypothetical protein
MREMDPIWKICIEADDRANKTCKESIAQAEREWEIAVAPATEALNNAIALAESICAEAHAKNMETYNPKGPIFRVQTTPKVI